MSALDVCEPEVIRALEKEGWQVLEKPRAIRTRSRFLFADMSLQKSANGTSETIIILEVKCFTNPDTDLAEFYTAIGQYQVYRNALAIQNIYFPLYLAVPEAAYERFVLQAEIIATIRDAGVKLVIVDIEAETVTRWLP